MNIMPDLSRLPLAITPSGDEKEMLSVFSEGGKTVVKINFSSLSVIQECGRKADYSLIRKLKSRSSSPALVFGTGIHKALEVFYSAPRERRKMPRDFEENAALMAYGHAAPSDELLYACISAFVAQNEPLRALPDTDKRSLASGVWMLTHYFKAYIDDPWEVFVDDKGPVTERRCEAVLFEDEKLKIILHGTIDVVLRNAQNGAVLPADHKTSSIVGNDFYNRLKPNAQYTAYFWLAKEVLGIQGDGFLVNCLEVKAKPLTARGGPPKFPRQVTDRTEADIAEFKQQVVSYTKQFLSWREENFYPQGSVSICANYGGCQYLDVCRAPESIRETIIENKFSEGSQI
jgi:hypothetical protein